MNQQGLVFTVILKDWGMKRGTESQYIQHFIHQQMRYFEQMGYNFKFNKIIIDKQSCAMLKRLGISSLPCLYKVRRNGPNLKYQGANNIKKFLLKDINEFINHQKKQEDRLLNTSTRDIYEEQMSILDEGDNEDNNEGFDRRSFERRMSRFNERRGGRDSVDNNTKSRFSGSYGNENNVGEVFDRVGEDRLKYQHNQHQQDNERTFESTGLFEDFTDGDLQTYLAQEAKGGMGF